MPGLYAIGHDEALCSGPTTWAVARPSASPGTQGGWHLGFGAGRRPTAQGRDRPRGGTAGARPTRHSVRPRARLPVLPRCESPGPVRWPDPRLPLIAQSASAAWCFRGVVLLHRTTTGRARRPEQRSRSSGIAVGWTRRRRAARGALPQAMRLERRRRAWCTSRRITSARLLAGAVSFYNPPRSSSAASWPRCTRPARRYPRHRLRRALPTPRARWRLEGTAAGDEAGEPAAGALLQEHRLLSREACGAAARETRGQAQRCRPSSSSRHGTRLTSW